MNSTKRLDTLMNSLKDDEETDLFLVVLSFAPFLMITWTLSTNQIIW